MALLKQQNSEKGFNTEEGNDTGSEWAAKAKTPKNDMGEADGREFEESLVEDRTRYV